MKMYEKTAPQYNSNSLNCKTHSRTSPEIQDKELKEQHKSTPSDQQNNASQNKKNQQKIEKLNQTN